MGAPMNCHLYHGDAGDQYKSYQTHEPEVYDKKTTMFVTNIHLLNNKLTIDSFFQLIYIISSLHILRHS